MFGWHMWSHVCFFLLLSLSLVNELVFVLCLGGVDVWVWVLSSCIILI